MTPIRTLSIRERAAYRGAVRAHGRLTELPAGGPHDHVCWVYDDDGQLDAAVGQFLAGGAARGERLLCVGDGVVERLRGDSPPLDGAAALIEAGALETLTVADAYEAAGGEFAPGTQLEFYEALTRRAREDGYTGLRVVAEISALAADPARRAQLVRWEHLADAFVAAGSGFTAMCAYRADLGPEALSDVAAVHPLVHTPEGVPAFQVFFDEDRVVLTGSVDTFSAGLLRDILDSSPDGEQAVLDVSPLEFVDVAGCRVMVLWARARASRGVAVEVVGASRLLRRMWRLITPDEPAPVRFVAADA